MNRSFLSAALLLALAFGAPAGAEPAPGASPALSARATIAALEKADPEPLLQRLVQLRGAPMRDAAARLAEFTAALAAYDRATADAIRSHPQNTLIALYRAKFLRSVGRDADAVALLEPFLADLPATVRRDRWGEWLVNEAAFALLAQGREQEAVDLMSRLAALPFRGSPELLGPNINYAAMLWQVKRPAEALAHLGTFAGPADRYGSMVGWMWTASNQVCALKSLARDREAAKLARAMREQRRKSPNTYMRALLCLGDLDAAAEFLLERLRRIDPAAALVALQDYQPGGSATGLQAVLVRRLTIVRDRAEVRQAVEDVGLIMRLPLVRRYFGTM